MKATSALVFRLVTVANFACIAMLVSAGCKTVTRVEEKPLASSKEIPVEMTALESIPPATQAALLYAGKLEEQDQVTEAANIYEQLLTEHPDNKVALHRLAVIHSQLGNFDKAENYFHEVISLDHNNAEILCDFGFNCFLQNKLIDAEKSYLSALNINGDIKRLHNNLAILYARTNRADHAMDQFRAAGCDPVTARQNLVSVMNDTNLESVPPALPFDSRPAPTSDSWQPEGSTSVPVINFSSPPSQHISNPMASSWQAATDGFNSSESPEIAQVAFWEPVDQSSPSKIVQQNAPSAVMSSRRKHMK